MTVKIRTLAIDDHGDIMRLWKKAGLPSRPKGRDSRRQMERQMKSFPDFFIGAFDDRKLVGVVIGSYDGRMKGWINRLAVDPQYQRRGVAQELVNAAEKALENHGVEIFCALIELPNEESTGLFEKLGYKSHQNILYVSKRKSEEI